MQNNYSANGEVNCLKTFLINNLQTSLQEYYEMKNK